MAIFVGVDAGGTGCRASLYEASGKLIGEGSAGAANVFSNFPQAMLHIDLAIERAIEDSCRAINKKQLIVGAGCAGGQTAQAKEQLNALEHPYQHLFMTSDLHVSCLAANNGDDCVVLITGTGSSIAHYHNGEVFQYGGYGFAHGDEASGAWLGLKSVKLLLKSYDNLANDKEFFTSISQALGFDYMPQANGAQKNYAVDSILNRFKQKAPSDYAALAPDILNLYLAGNQTASQLLEEGAEYLYSMLVVNKLYRDAPIFMTGGLAGVYQTLLAAKLEQQVKIMNSPAQEGARLFAQKQLGRNT